MASYLNEQYQRFYEILSAKDKYNVVCEECPIYKECMAYSDQLTPEEQPTSPCCEELLFRYMLTGEKPTLKGD